MVVHFLFKCPFKSLFTEFKRMTVKNTITLYIRRYAVEKLSLRKQLTIVRLYLNGFSYHEIATRSGVSKGTVANVVADVKAGRILDAQEPAEQLELLRELAIDLRRLRLTPSQAIAGLTVVSRLQELGVEPADIERWAAMCCQIAADQCEVPVFVRAALALEEVRERTGLSLEALDKKGRTLEEEVARLELKARELKECQRELEKLGKRRQSLADEVGQLEERYEPLSRSVTQKERREEELSHRVQELEQRAQGADERLAAARRELEALAGLGLSLDDLPGFVQRLSSVAQRYGVEPEGLLDRLMSELEELEAGLGLESRLEPKREELNNVEQAIVKARQEREALDSALQQLRQQQATLRKSIAEEQAHVRKEMQAIAKIARDASAELRQDMRKGIAEAVLEVQRVRDQALEVGQELGHFEATIEANEWLRSLLPLVKGDGSVDASQVRAIGLSVLRGVQRWLEQSQNEMQLPYLLTIQVSAAAEGLEQWKV
jgi:predicted  nucleic acid-binding Zn-ribbon protein/predicted DNA-binding protein YlxM (UPF0122 family)